MQNMTDLNIMADKLKIGIFGGAFNPVHNGHLNLAKHYLDELGLDKILFIPTIYRRINQTKILQAEKTDLI